MAQHVHMRSEADSRLITANGNQVSTLLHSLTQLSVTLQLHLTNQNSESNGLPTTLTVEPIELEDTSSVLNMAPAPYGPQTPVDGGSDSAMTGILDDTL